MGRALVPVSVVALADLLRGRWPMGWCEWTDAPNDLTVVGVEHPPAGYGHIWFYAVVESDSFPEVKPGQPLTELPPFKYRRKTP
jgi:hypothetical protein